MSVYLETLSFSLSEMSSFFKINISKPSSSIMMMIIMGVIATRKDCPFVIVAKFKRNFHHLNGKRKMSYVLHFFSNVTGSGFV